jgi:hypothetical protein
VNPIASAAQIRSLPELTDTWRGALLAYWSLLRAFLLAAEPRSTSPGPASSTEGPARITRIAAGDSR